ncbi:hypothetical protein AK812_SmicGene7248 [Symbiodinium microadriaticum]|uniref:Uncharacterized protein n=1 Tax=Symbiodinium microadriaticum TaxID=2951 RepID=A0A1Q9ENX5_SYMMI|nr:hypothetical protein AK812_SmicGene7248 [Symbiodinium microadriaticum]
MASVALGSSSSAHHRAEELDEGWGGVDRTAEELDEGLECICKLATVRELEMPTKSAGSCTCPSTTGGHSLLAQLQSDMERVLKRMEVVETHLGLSEKLRVERVGNQDVDDTKEVNQNVQVLEVSDAFKAAIPGVTGAETAGKAKNGFWKRRLDEFRFSTTTTFSEVEFEHSVWSIPIVSGLTDVGWFDRLFASMLVLLNLGMQTAFSWILLTDAFIGEDFEAKVGSAKVWRTSIAHDHKYSDFADTSLVSRVCSGDGALILSTIQATLVTHINSYLGLQERHFAPSMFEPGVLLCMLCILLWALCVYKEYRRIFLELEAAIGIPKSRRTVFRQNAFVSISWGRFLMLLVTSLARALIASVLLVAGILWLARTTSIQELMLNAVALNAILDVDEFLFAGMVPIKTQHFIKELQPIHVRYSRIRSQFETLVHCISLLLLVFTSYFLLLAPLSDTMLSVKHELCGGNQTFVAAFNPDTQFTFGKVTADSRYARDLSSTEMAVQAQEDVARTMKEEAALYPFCTETMIMQADGPFYDDEALQAIARQLLNNAAASVGRVDAQSCHELRDFCTSPDARLVRLVCGDTCGCTDPTSFAWYKVESQGCTSACLQVGRMTLQNRSCLDSPIDEIWSNFWNAYPSVLSGWFGRPIQSNRLYSLVQQTQQAMLDQGCAALAQFPSDFLTGSVWCQGSSDLFWPLSSLCPQTCGCDVPDVPFANYCPGSCVVYIRFPK